MDARLIKRKHLSAIYVNLQLSFEMFPATPRMASYEFILSKAIRLCAKWWRKPLRSPVLVVCSAASGRGRCFSRLHLQQFCSHLNRIDLSIKRKRKRFLGLRNSPKAKAPAGGCSCHLLLLITHLSTHSVIREFLCLNYRGMAILT